MSLSDLTAALETAAPGAVFEREAPSGTARCVVWARYNYKRVYGDDRTVTRVPRVQLDLLWQQRADTLLEDVLNVLDYYRLPYELQDVTWDDERQLNRAIVQLTVV